MMTRDDRTPVELAPALPERMRAIVQRQYGSADQLRIEQVDSPPLPAQGQVLVKVAAAGLDRGTWHLMTGQPYLVRPAVGLRRPRNPVPGRDVAGTIVAIGPGVSRFTLGDRVFGVAPGSFAEYALADEKKLAAAPNSLTNTQAATLGISGLTALQALHNSGRLAAGQRVLILGASGGVGTYAVQMAKATGAEVTGVCSGPKIEPVRALGADHVIDYQIHDPIDGTQQYDLIVDIGGNRGIARLRRALTPTGTLAVVGGENAGKWTGGLGRQLRAAARSPFLRQRLVMVVSAERGSDLGTLAHMADEGHLRPVLDSVFPLERAADAMRRLESGQVCGKVAIDVSDEKHASAA